MTYFENFNTEGTVIESASVDRDYPSKVTFNDTVDVDDLATEIARLINHSVVDLGINPNEICIVAPWWIHLAPMTRTLVASLPGYEFDGPGLVPFSRDQDNLWFKVAKIALTEASPDVFLRRLKWSRDIIADLNHCGVDTALLTPRSLLRASNSVTIETTDGLDFLREYFDLVMSLLGIKFRDYSSFT